MEKGKSVETLNMISSLFNLGLGANFYLNLESFVDLV